MIDLFQTGVLLRCPGGQVETVPQQVAAGMKWAALNLGTDPCVQRNPAVWDHQRSLYKGSGVAIGPWMHCRSLADIDFLISVGQTWVEAQFIGCNIEDVVSDKLSLQQVGKVLQDCWVFKYGKPVHMPSLPWLQNGQGWKYVDFCTIALEMFPEEGDGQKYLDQYQACIDHAFAEGAKKVTLLYSTQSPRKVYPNVAHCLYTADNVDAWPNWHDTVPQVIPKPPPVNGGTVPLDPNAKKEFRAELVKYALAAEKAERLWHYTQQRPYTGLHTPATDTHYNDCSSYVAICFYKAGRNSGHPVADPLGMHYSGWGFTGTAYDYLKAHKAPVDKYRVGDVAIYGSPSNTVHMTVCRKAGTAQTAIWSSFGQEAGPESRQPLSYHPAPVLGVYRHPALL